MHRALTGVLLTAVAALDGCMMTSAGHQLPPISPAKPQAQINLLEETIGDFSFNLDGGGVVTSNKAGRMLNDQILTRWKKNGYIQEHQYVPNGAFTERSRYHLTLSGSQKGESNVGLQFLSGLTLFLVPHFIDTQYKVEYKLEDTITGEVCTASVADNYKTT